ncbi:MAG: hypothetical protein NC489_12810 [Ruminococcus flavefaciens]|nr:hypothetical protein [Ruminococcus flavefaciens]
MKKAILFGAGIIGEGAYYKIKAQEEIAYYVDNNPDKQGTRLHDIPVVSSRKLEEIYDPAVYDIIICMKKYDQVVEQLSGMGIKEYYILLQGLLYCCDEKGVLFPAGTLVPTERYTPYIKRNPMEKNILFVQNRACIRTHKIAAMMHKNGYKVFLLQTNPTPEANYSDFAEVYEEVYTFHTYNGLINFVNDSDFDIIHSSNEPDILTNLLLLTRKHVVFDTHDMMSLRKPESKEIVALEYIANTGSDGNIYTSDAVVGIARKKFNLADKEVIAWENMILDQEEIINEHPKLSSMDGEIHCVYEGGVVGNDKMSHRYFEDIWGKIVDCGIHIHYYSPSNYSYCKELESKSKYLHFEGNLGTKKLIQEMTKYDCGLLLLNMNEQNEAFLETASPNKLYEYINAGLPVIVGNVTPLINFVEKYGAGKKLDMKGDIKAQIAAISKIMIEKDFLIKNKLTMMSRSQELIDFYERVKSRKVRRLNRYL